MTTIAEKTADVSTLLDDIVATATGLAEWSDADANIVNDQSTGDWWNNARVLANANSGTYLLLYHTSDRFRTCSREGESTGDLRWENGLRVIHSTEWDSSFAYSSGAPGGPSGLTTCTSQDGNNTTESPYDDVEENPDASTRSASFPSFTGDTGTGIGMWIRDTSSISATEPASYFGSIGPDHISMAVWHGDMANVSTGQASIFGWENLTNTFWSHGISPSVAMLCRTSHGRSDTNQYLDEQYPKTCLGFTEYYAPNSHSPEEWIGRVGTRQGVIGEGRWGFVNPDASDDQLIYRRVPVYSAADQQVPIAELNSFLPAEWPHGPGHGLEVTADTINYRSYEKYGNGHHHPCKAWVRYD